MGDTSFEFGCNIEQPEETQDYLAQITCQQVLKMVGNITATVRKANRVPMTAKKPSKGNGANGTAPPPSAGENGEFLPFLKVGNLIKDKILKIGQSFTLTVTEAREAPKDSFSDVFVDVKIGKESYTWGLTADKKAYASLYERFGGNLAKWKGSVKCELSRPYKKGYNPSIQVL